MNLADPTVLESARKTGRECQRLARALGNYQSSPATVNPAFLRAVADVLRAASKFDGYPGRTAIQDCVRWTIKASDIARFNLFLWTYRRLRWLCFRLAGIPATYHPVLTPQETTDLVNTLLNAGNFLDAQTRYITQGIQ